MHEHSTSSLTGLILPLADRYLLLPNVAVAELIDYQRGEPASDAPPWYLRQVTWRNQQLPLISFEAACGSKLVVGDRARIVVLNALGGRPELKFIALVLQGIPRSYKLDSQLSFVDVPLCRLEKAAVQVGEWVAKVPDLLGLEQLVLESGLA
ncbi:chemotaxis protein CheW [Pseudomonas gingeri]|uniref:Chemotaxis protein CheW n=1 Tax=Pseudomonas gingeri TaxID=117681 RepID=A0A7Y7XGB5_9PSED|nr:chemotaxis protein CheW [Pseudomonas gingeri]NWA29370.1 chemotaxis protein CheW [Pseudomonas gingeri]NWB99322.1 chemotaxis protein CheW [Pseudomonas gingeri]NWD72180.1 chemotaxis protein CheW [Pseudomonas gingeri]NWD78077.1 chemotaxis protein CheW [Pseudomonas gingeri]